MAQDKKVEQITSMEDDFAQWYTDICKKAELIDYSSVKGFMILRPYGYAIWENIMHLLDARFKATGHENVAMPLFIPESLLQKEKDHAKDKKAYIVPGTGRFHIGIIDAVSRMDDETVKAWARLYEVGC